MFGNWDVVNLGEH